MQVHKILLIILSLSAGMEYQIIKTNNANKKLTQFVVNLERQIPETDENKLSDLEDKVELLDAEIWADKERQRDLVREQETQKELDKEAREEQERNARNRQIELETKVNTDEVFQEGQRIHDELNYVKKGY